jgi:hypothetical protein
MRKFVILVALAVSASATATVGASVASAAVLNVTFAGSGKGAVTSNPAGIDCSNVPGSTQTACSHDFGLFFGTAKLTAKAGDGSALVAWSGDAGGTCSGATNPCQTGSLLSGTLSAVATFAPAPDVPTVTTGAAGEVAFPSARVAGSVNPNSDDFVIRECYVEYGLTAKYGERARCRPETIGAGTSPVAVSASIGVLEPGRIYHYRLVASNGSGAGIGDDRTFTSGAAPADACPNAAIRAQQGALAQRLPNCGAYELVSPSFTAGQGAAAAAGTADGNNATLGSAGVFAGAENMNDVGVRYRTERTDSGWKTTAIAPPGRDFPFIGYWGTVDTTRDGSRSLWFPNLKADEGTMRFTPVVRDPDGSSHVAGLTADRSPLTPIPPIPVGTSEDLLTVVQSTYPRSGLTEGRVDSRDPALKSLYATTRKANGELATRQVAYRDGATMFPGCGTLLGGVNAIGGSVIARNAVSRDGTKIFFTAGECYTPEHERVWAKVGDDDPIDISASQCEAVCGDPSRAEFLGASRDGSRVFFATEQRLLLEDQDTSAQRDLYEYDFNASGQKLRLVTGGADPEGADVRSLPVFRMSDDGAYVYFVAGGRALAGENARGAAPQPGENNLYVYHRGAGQAAGTTTFVGTLAPDYGEATQVSSTGRYLLLKSTADLTGQRLAGDTFTDLYRYDAQDDELLRAWTDDPEHNGAARAGGAQLAYLAESMEGAPGGATQRNAGWTPQLQVSDDGSKVGFTTSEPLSRDDHNSTADAYLWHADTGRMTLLTDGTSVTAGQFTGSQFLGMTPSGDSLFVMSASPLLREHTSGQNASYVIRSGGGFPDAAPPEPCAGDACQGPPAAAPLVLPGIGSVAFTGPGNVLGVSNAVSVSRLKAVTGWAAKLKVRVPAAGRVSVTGSSVRKAQKSATKAQTVTVQVALSAKARKTLKKKKRIGVKVRVVFQPKAGDPVSKTVTVTFKQPKANKKGGR